MSVAQELIHKAERREALFGIVGCGYVGLPLAVELARAGYRVLGYDVNPRVVAGLKGADAGDIVVFAGGIIPEEDVADLAKTGVRKVFGPGTMLAEITSWIATEIRPRTRAA